MTAEKPKVKVVIKFGTLGLWGGSEVNVEQVITGRKVRFFKIPPMCFRLGPVSFTYKGEEILSAPIDTCEFAERFLRDIHLINVLIKEVTLGAVARKS